MTLKAVFFDLDGTLLDTALDLSAALNKVMVEDGLSPLPIEKTRGIVSEGSFALVKLGYQLQDGHPRIDSLRQRLLDHYLADLASHTEMFDGIDELITTLTQHDIGWGIVTNKPWPYTEPLMEAFQFASPPLCVICPEHVTHRKPAPDSLTLACEKAHCDTSEAIYIGDHQRDISCGQNAGMPTIAVSYGYIAKDDNIHSWNADHIAVTAHDLWPLINTYRQ